MRKLLVLLIILCLAQTVYGYQPPDDQGRWPVADAGDKGWQVDHFDQLSSAVEAQDLKQITSVLVAHHGHLIYEAYFNGGGPDQLNDMRSATKSVTSLLLGAAIADNKISGVDAQVYSFFPDKQPVANPDPRKNAITLEDLLTMSSVWECNDNNSFSRGNEERMYIIEDWVQFALDLPVKGYPHWETEPHEDPYGRGFSYCTAGSFILGAVVEKVTGQSMADYARKVLHQPLGIDQVQWFHSPLGVTMGGGGTRYRSRDYLRIGEMVRNRGRHGDRQLLPAEWIEQSLTPRAQVREGAEYGYQWWRMQFPHGDDQLWFWAAAGNGGNYLLINQELGLVALITSQAYNTPYGHPQSQRIMREFILPAMP
ncbi:MAG: serine hydrolase domain-containing protein [Wenzhouxiangellaceae bacterium]